VQSEGFMVGLQAWILTTGSGVARKSLPEATILGSRAEQRAIDRVCRFLNAHVPNTVGGDAPTA